MAMQLYQCERCKEYMDYEGTFVDVQATQMGYNQSGVRWCDDCLAKVKQRPTVDRPRPIAVEG